MPKSVEAAQIAEQAAALYEMLNPGTIARVIKGDQSAQLALGDFLQDGTIAKGEIEIFPELTEGERRLGEPPGFTPERIDQWLETYRAEVLGLPNHTGSPAAEDPTGNIISTPIPDEAGPNIVEARGMRRSSPLEGIRLGTTAARATGWNTSWEKGTLSGRSMTSSPIPDPILAESSPGVVNTGARASFRVRLPGEREPRIRESMADFYRSAATIRNLNRTCGAA